MAQRLHQLLRPRFAAIGSPLRHEIAVSSCGNVIRTTQKRLNHGAAVCCRGEDFDVVA